MIALSGVRSSCDMLAKNSVFRRLASCIRDSSRLRSVMSRIALDTSVPSSVCSGLRLISIGNSVPSFRKPNNSRPEPIARGRGAAKYPVRCPGCARRNRSGTSSSTQLPDQFLPTVPEQFLGLAFDELNAPVLVDETMASGRRLQQISKLILGLLSSADVPDGARHQDVVFRVKRTQADLNRKLCPVFAQAEEFKADPIERTARLGEEVRRWLGCAARTRSGMSISTRCPSSSALAYPKSFSVCAFTMTMSP